MKYNAICKLKNGKENKIMFNDISKYDYLCGLKIFKDIQVYDEGNNHVRSITIFDDGSCIAGATILANNMIINK